MAKSTAYIEMGPDMVMEDYALSACKGFEWNGYEIRFFAPLMPESAPSGPQGAMWRPYDVVPPLHPNIPVVGSIKSMIELFRRYKKTLPLPLNVPEELLPYSGRRIQRMTIAEFDPANLIDRSAFIKPAESVKLWTGDVVSKPRHLDLLFGDAPKDTPILVSPVVEILTEYRVFVNRDRQIAGMRHYAGDPFVVPFRLTIENMIKAYTQAPVCYALDVGVQPGAWAEDPLKNAPTFVVECNDFWSLGTYGFESITYANMLAQRWHQLITSL